ncbi:hypothetical protein AtubIFM55763_001754 [Aspergillus tubingensis]|nr:hypothetical protein AtubIFM55763_001754 [Aspergillus tubingensis]GLB23727.1 hypothetical protein AtubIFM61612_004326 [Aspergillus tubingensis]
MAHDWTTPSAPSSTALLAVTSVFTVTSLSALTLRFYARRLARLDLLADDWLALAALIFTLVYNSTLLAGTSRDIIANHTKPTAQTEVAARKYQLALQVIEIIALGLTKLSFFTLWKRVFSTHPVHRLCTFLIGAVTVWMVAFILATTLQCGGHVSRIWSSIEDVNNSNTCASANMGLNMWIGRKIGMIGLYIVGVYVTAISIARTYFTIVVSYNNDEKESRLSFMHELSLLALWAVVEVNVGILAASVTVVTRGVREVFADKRKKKFHMLSGVALKGDHGGVGNEGGTRISNESDGIE